MVYNYFMEFKIENNIVKDILTENEIAGIYSSVDNSYNEYVMDRYNQSVADFVLPPDIENKILGICRDVFAESDLILESYQFARYKNLQKSDGELGKPRLIPHFDSFPEARYTFDMQLKSNTSWSIYVEGKEFVLANNQALTFSGTHQIHWRPEKQFKDDDYIDMLFCHLQKKDDDKLTVDHWDKMLKKENFYLSNMEKV
jgi:hypothetical protein